MRVVRLLLLVTGLVLLGTAPAQAFCVIFSGLTTPNTEVYDMEITGTSGNFSTLALLERINSRAAHGTAVLRDSTVALGITRPGNVSVVTYQCGAVDFATLAGQCRINILFLEPADGTSTSQTRTVQITNASCASQGF